mmetsp:Transcript_34396/g.64126  ORF Transcript_34396/g.64126 Transcript_34396/m.64126 type:complete len:227 (+) Transcript_34396:529-1209(+)
MYVSPPVMAPPAAVPPGARPIASRANSFATPALSVLLFAAVSRTNSNVTPASPRFRCPAVPNLGKRRARQGYGPRNLRFEDTCIGSTASSVAGASSSALLSGAELPDEAMGFTPAASSSSSSTSSAAFSACSFNFSAFNCSLSPWDSSSPMLADGGYRPDWYRAANVDARMPTPEMAGLNMAAGLNDRRMIARACSGFNSPIGLSACNRLCSTRECEGGMEQADVH